MKYDDDDDEESADHHNPDNDSAMFIDVRLWSHDRGQQQQQQGESTTFNNIPFQLLDVFGMNFEVHIEVTLVLHTSSRHIQCISMRSVCPCSCCY